jgi:hypothetical protein
VQKAGQGINLAYETYTRFSSTARDVIDETPRRARLLLTRRPA